tara:strand:+ start:39137 stop:39274 length:138 start_codon:yes stop_codon:yes gene_type:complete
MAMAAYPNIYIQLSPRAEDERAEDSNIVNLSYPRAEEQTYAQAED